MRQESTACNLVIVSYYDQRPIEPLVQLLDQIGKTDAGARHDLLVVVNATQTRGIDLPGRHANVPVLNRNNGGFNVGAWQFGWQQRPDYDFYLFLQDECVIRKAGWLWAFLRASSASSGFVGESLSLFSSWDAFRCNWVSIADACAAISATRNVPLGPSPDHLQTLAIGARRRVLEATGGFIEDDDKVLAMGGEVMTSVRARHLGFRNRQVAWRPFEYIGHPQWTDIRKRSRSLTWHVSRALRLVCRA